MRGDRGPLVNTSNAPRRKLSNKISRKLDVGNPHRLCCKDLVQTLQSNVTDLRPKVRIAKDRADSLLYGLEIWLTLTTSRKYGSDIEREM